MGTRIAPMLFGRGRFSAPGPNLFSLWPALSYNDLPAALSGFTEPTPPTTSGGEVEVTTAAELETAAATSGTLIRVTAGWTGTARLIGVTDIDIIVADGVTITGRIRVDTSSARVRVRGAGSTSTLGSFAAINSDDIIIDSLLMPQGAEGMPIWLAGAVSRVAVIAVVTHTDASSTTPPLWDGGGVAGALADILVAGCNFGTTVNATPGDSDWSLRIEDSARVVLVDSQFQNDTPQHNLRLSGTPFATFRITTVDLLYGRSVSPGSGTSIRQFSPRHYINAPSDGSYFYGGPAQTGTVLSYMTDAEFHTPDAPDPAHIDDAVVESAEGFVAESDNQWRLGTPSYNTLAEHPGWTAPTSPNTGITMGTADPFLL